MYSACISVTHQNIQLHCFIRPFVYNTDEFGGALLDLASSRPNYSCNNCRLQRDTYRALPYSLCIPSVNVVGTEVFGGAGTGRLPHETGWLLVRAKATRDIQGGRQGYCPSRLSGCTPRPLLCDPGGRRGDGCSTFG